MIDFLTTTSEHYEEYLSIFALVFMLFLIEIFIITGQWKKESSLFLSTINYAICLFIYTINYEKTAITTGLVGYFVIFIYATFYRKKIGGFN